MELISTLIAFGLLISVLHLIQATACSVNEQKGNSGFLNVSNTSQVSVQDTISYLHIYLPPYYLPHKLACKLKIYIKKNNKTLSKTAVLGEKQSNFKSLGETTK